MEHKHLQNKCKPTSVWKFLTILKKLKKVRILRDAFFFCIFTLFDDGDYCMMQPDVDEYGLLQYQSCISNEIIGSNCSSG